MTDSDASVSLREYALRLVAKREYSVFDFQKKLKKRFPDNSQETEKISQEFLDKNWLNDERFAEFFVVDKVNLRRWGRLKIFLELKQHGIEEEMANKALDTFFPEKIEQEKIAKIAELKKEQLLRKNPEISSLELRQKIFSYLLSKGFPSDGIVKVLD